MDLEGTGEECDSLWEFFHRLEIWDRSSKLRTPVIVLDQFEEVFTLGQMNSEARKSVAELFVALGDLVENRLPRALVPVVSKNEKDERAKFLQRVPLVKVVLSLREEYLPHLEAHRAELPSLMRNRMRLLPFSGTRAVDAIVESSKGLLEEAVAKEIVRAVAGRRRAVAGRASPTTAEGEAPPSERIWRRLVPFGGTRTAPATEPERAPLPLDDLEIEPSILNLFCYQLNERRLKPPVTARIGADLLRKTGKDILSDFYESCLEGQSTGVREFVEERLLSSSGYRLPVPVEDAVKQKAVTEQVLDMLERRRLVRRETRSQGIYVELVHDVLARTILESKAKRDETRRALRWIRAVTGLVVGVSIGWFGVLEPRVRDEGLAQLIQRRREIQAKEGELLAKKGELQEKKGEIEEAKKDISSSKGELQTLQAQLEESRGKEAEAKGRADAAQARLAKLQEQADKAELEAARLRASVAVVSKLMAAQNASYGRLKSDSDELTRKLRELDLARQGLEKAIESQKVQIGVPDHME
jgi:hypothetical protein